MKFRLKRYRKRFLAIGLLLYILLSSAACGKDNNGIDETGKETGTSVPAGMIDLSAYRIIVPEKATDSYKRVYSAFIRALKEKTGLEIENSDDFVKEGTEFTETACEILIGNTKRKESAMETTADQNAYVIRYVNRKIVINAESEYALEYALNSFLEESVVAGSPYIEVPDRSGTYVLYFKNLENITLAGLGDSYFKYSKMPAEQHWIALLADRYHMNLYNKGIGGSTVSAYSGDGNNHNPMVNRLDALPEKADIILFEGGANDYQQNAPIGDLDSRDQYTFAGAVNHILDVLKADHPNSLIICITPWCTNISRYANAMISICEKRGIPCFDATDQALTKVRMDSASFRAEYCMRSNDTNHLNAEGMKLVLPAFEKFIGEEYDRYLAKQNQRIG